MELIKHNLLKKMFMSIVLLMFTLVAFGFSNAGEVPLNTSINKQVGSIEIAWTKIPDAHEYLIYHNNKLVFKTEDNKFEHTGLKDGEYLEYDLYAVNKENKILDNNHIITSAIHPEYSKTQLGLDIITSKDGVNLKWKEFNNSGETTYLISKDNKNYINNFELKSVSKSNVQISNLDANSEYYVSVTTENLSASKNDPSSIQGDHYLEIPVKTLKNMIGYDLSSLENPDLSILAAGDDVTSIRHRTFIAPDPFKVTYKSYGIECGSGDGRSFSATSGTHRTQLDLSIYWSEIDFSVGKSASPSTKYANSSSCTGGTTLNTSATGMNASKISLFGSEGVFQVKHSIATPHKVWGLTMPAIDYNYQLQVLKSGATYITGSHDAFPWHEIYRLDKVGGWKELYTFAPEKGANIVYNLLPLFENTKVQIAK